MSYKEGDGRKFLVAANLASALCVSNWLSSPFFHMPWWYDALMFVVLVMNCYFVVNNWRDK